MSNKTGEPRCRECGMKLFSWREHHTIRACEMYVSGHSVTEVRNEMLKEKAPLYMKGRHD